MSKKIIFITPRIEISKYGDKQYSLDLNWFGFVKKLGFEVLDTQGNFSHVKFGKFRNEIFSKLDKIVYYRKDFKQDCLKGFSRFSSAPKNIMRIIINNIKKILP